MKALSLSGWMIATYLCFELMCAELDDDAKNELSNSIVPTLRKKKLDWFSAYTIFVFHSIRGTGTTRAKLTFFANLVLVAMVALESLMYCVYVHLFGFNYLACLYLGLSVAMYRSIYHAFSIGEICDLFFPVKLKPVHVHLD